MPSTRATTVKPPTLAQREFAAGIAAGKPKTKAYKLAHPTNQLAPASLQKRASKASKAPAVQAEIARLMRDPLLLDICPESDDPAHLRAHGIAAMARLARVCTDPVISLHAAIWLVDYADRMDEARAEAVIAVSESPAEKREEIIRNLRGLYAKALQPPLVAPVEPAAATENAQEPPGSIADTPQDPEHQTDPSDRS